jgi:hypothetical protein
MNESRQITIDNERTQGSDDVRNDTRRHPWHHKMTF